MQTLRQLSRLSTIIRTLLKYRLDHILSEMDVDNHLGWFRIFYPSLWSNKETHSRGKSIRLALESLGPIFVKFGQVLSMRRDMIPEDIIEELSLLQDRVPPFSSALAKEMIEARYGQSVTDIFAAFDEHPFASASIAQVHGAILKTGESAIVKVLRPGVGKEIKKDVALMEFIARFFHKYFPVTRRFRPKEVVAEFKMTLLDELDLLREAANASQLRRNFKDSPLIYVPEIYWDYCKHDIIVMERVNGVPISDIETLKAKGCNMRVLAERGVEIFFTQVFRDSFFHADMHPGNLFVNVDNPEKPQYIAVDFGIMGTLGPNDQKYLAENFLAFFNRDYRRVAELHVQSGWVPDSTPIEGFESAIRTVCEPIFERPLEDISVAQTLIRLFQTAGRFNMPIQPQLILLQKTLLNIEGLGRQLYPQLDLWATAKPFLEKWMKERVSVKRLFKQIKTQIPYWLESLQKTSPSNATPNKSDNGYNTSEIHPLLSISALLSLGVLLGLIIGLIL